MIESSRDDVDTWFDDLLECLADNSPTLWTMKDLYILYSTANPKAKESPQMFTRRIKPRLIKVAGGNPVALADNNMDRNRLYMLRGTPQSLTYAQLRVLYAQERGESSVEVIH